MSLTFCAIYPTIKSGVQAVFLVMGSFYASSDIDTPNTSEKLFVTSAGHDFLVNTSFARTVRPEGRRDYQILFVKSGHLEYYIGEKKYICEKNSILLYRPLEPQYYVMYRSDNTEIYWIHFTGNSVEDYLDPLGLSGKRCVPVVFSEKYEKIWDAIIYEFQHKDYNYVKIANLLFEELLMRLSRGLRQAQAQHPLYSEEIEKAITYFNVNYARSCDVNRLIAELNISSSWFAKLFRRQLGVSPHQYLTELRINKAKSMMSSNKSIGEIAAAVGYQDPLYFSRIFRKKTGYSPMQYRTLSVQLTSNRIFWEPENRPMPGEEAAPKASCKKESRP